MQGHLESHVSEVVSMLREVRSQWAQIKSLIEDDRHVILDTKGRLRGALGPMSMLTGQQGEAFDSAIDRYHANAIASEQALEDIIAELEACARNIHASAQEHDNRIRYQGDTDHVDEILRTVLPQITVAGMILRGDSSAYEIFEQHQQGILGSIENAWNAVEHAVTSVEQQFVSDLSALYNGLKETVASLARDVLNNWNALNDAYANACKAVGTVLGDVAAIVPVVEDALKDDKVGELLVKLGKDVPDATVLASIAGVVLDWGSDPGRSLNSLANDIIGGAIALGVGALDGGDIALAIAGAMNLESHVMSGVEGVVSNVMGGTSTLLGQDFGQLAKNWGKTADMLDVGKVMDDLGADVVDSAMYDVTSLVAPGQAINWEIKSYNDMSATLGDSKNLVIGVTQFEVNAKATIVSDGAAATNFVVQRGPFPPSFKAATATSTSAVVQNMTDVSNLVTNGELPRNAPPAYKAALVGETAAMAIGGF